MSEGSRSYDAVLCDLDGVLRLWDRAAERALEWRYGVPEGTVRATAFVPELLQPLVTGQVTDDEWRRNVAAALLPEYGRDVAIGLVADWSASAGAVNVGVLALLREVRASGVRIALATNQGDRLADDLRGLGLDGDFDAVVNSSELGVAKPEPTFFFAAALMVETEVDRCLFVDDDAVNVEVAKAVGMHAHLYAGVDDLRTTLLPPPGHGAPSPNDHVK